MKHTSQALIATLGGCLGFYLGEMNGFLYTLIALVVADYITGLLRAGVERKLDSKIGFKGIAKKAMIFIIVGIANLCNTHFLKGDGTMIRTAIVFFYIANEGLYILENLVAMGLPVPEHLKKMLQQLKEDKDEQ